MSFDVPMEVFLLAGLLVTISLAAGLSTEIAKSAFKRLDTKRWERRLPLISALFGTVWGVVGSPVLTHVLEQIFQQLADGELAAYQNQLRIWWGFLGMGAGWTSAGLYKQAKAWARPGLLRLLDWWKPDSDKSTQTSTTENTYESNDWAG